MGCCCAYIALFNAATLSFMGPPSELIANTRTSPEDFTIVPDWIPFESDIAYRLHEVMKLIHSVDADIATPDTVRFGYSIAGCDVVGIRTSPEFEPTWLHLLANKLYEKTILPIGYLFPHYLVDDDEESDCILLKKWLDQQKSDSVLYVALGSESILTQNELEELAFGLELCGLPFLLVLRNHEHGLCKNVLEMLPKGFENRVADRGLVHLGWAPQMKILSHPSTRGFLTHCGWNSIIEGLGLGRIMVLFPVMNDQGLIARLLVGKGLGVEITRDERDGSLRREAVVKAVQLAMVHKDGEALRIRCRSMKGVFGDKNLNDHYIEGFIHYLEKNRKSS